ncbi:autotransporter outer membrane beta-barrel domain-containing protein, partial [Fodinicurvata halophila]
AGEITGGDGDTFDGGAGIDAGDGSELMLDTDTTVTGGGGDDGGAGIEAGNESTLTLDADTTVTGGDGDDDGGTGIELGQNGWAEITGEITGGDGDIFDGGAGIEADSAIIIISGTVSGGFGNGTTEESDRAAAIELEGAEDDTNELELRAGFEINGIVDATEGEDDSLILGGTENAAFNSNLIGDGQQYQGFESYDKTGDSSWTLEGSGDQDWNVMGGNLAIDENASLGGVFDVAADGVIGGTGTIGDLLLSGVLNPGASVGTLEVDNDATFESGSAYIVEVDQSGADRLEIGGTASLAGDVLVESLEADEDESVLGDYTILSANAGLEGKFDGVGANHSFLIPLLSYSENDVVLRLAASGDLESLLEPYAEDPNAERFVDTLDDLDTDDPGYQAFENALLLLQSGQEGDAVDELSGETIPGFDSSVIQMANNFLSSIQGRISGGAGGGTQLSQGTSPRRLQLAALDIASSDADPHARQQAQADASGAVGRHAPAGPVTWARAVGNRSQLDASGSFPGVKARSAGVHAGIEAPLGDGLGDGLMVGGALGFERGQLESGELASSDFDAYSAGLYARQRIGALRLSGSGTFTQMSLDSQRQVTGFGTQEANYDAQVFALDAEAAYDIPLDETMTVSPLVGLRYSHTHRESYEEDGTAGLNVASTSETSVRSRLGAELAMELDPAVLSVRAAWSRELASPDASTEASLLGGDDFTIEGQTIPENLAEVGLGLDVQVDDNVELFAAYDGAFSSRYRSHSGQLGVRVTW